jgi:hypothetical protein
VVVALILVGTSLRGLTTSVHVVGTTQSSQAEALYRQALGASAGQRPTEVIVVSSKSSTVSDGSFQQFVARLAAQVRAAPGVTHVATDLEPGGEWAWVLTVIAEHQAHAGTGDEVAHVRYPASSWRSRCQACSAASSAVLAAVISASISSG